MTKLRQEDGFALVTAIVVVTVMIGLATGLLLLTDNQQHAAQKEQASEYAFDAAEAALNAQIGQLSRSWPSANEKEVDAAVCTAATTTATNYCPSKESLSVGYPNASPTSCVSGQKAEPWGSSLTNQWTTYVRDDVGESPVFNSATEDSVSTASYDANGNGKLWVRAVGSVQCHYTSLVALVSEQLLSVSFPLSAVSGNWFKTTNEGNKEIVNTQGKSSQAGKISMRCSGKTEEECYKYNKEKGQVLPDTTKPLSSTPSPALSATEIERLKATAKSLGTYFAAGVCPASLEALKGRPTFVTGPCTLSFTGNGVGNSEANPGFLIIEKGTFEMNGTTAFFGTVYDMNKQESSEVVVEVHGNAVLTGSIVVDGKGGIGFGKSAENFIYSPKASEELKSFRGAAANRNSFRILPSNE